MSADWEREGRGEGTILCRSAPSLEAQWQSRMVICAKMVAKTTSKPRRNSCLLVGRFEQHSVAICKNACLREEKRKKRGDERWEEKVRGVEEEGKESGRESAGEETKEMNGRERVGIAFVRALCARPMAQQQICKTMVLHGSNLVCQNRPMCV